jgi:uncharacterized protein (TIGR00369 family)
MNKQPNSRMCFVCGVENPAGLHLQFYDDGLDEVRSDFVIAEHHQGYPGIAQGGIIAAILDEVGGRTVMIHDPNNFFVTAKLEVRYVKPVPTGKPLYGRGALVSIKARVAQARAEIRDLEDEILAEAKLVLYQVPSEVFQSTEADKIGWKVYP